jgi:hypothetical protein
LIQYLLSVKGGAPNMGMNGPLLLVYGSRGSGSEQVRWLINVGREIIRSIPDYVRRERGIGAKTGGNP